MTTLANVLTAGDTLDFTTSVPDYLASAGWTLKYRLAPRVSGVAIDLMGSASGDDHRITATASTTAGWAEGYYAWAAYVEKGSERYTVDRGELEIRAASAALAAGTDLRTHARKVLDAIEAVLENRATLDQEEYAINGRSLKRTPIPDLLRLRSLYKGEVRNEDAAANLAAGLPVGGKLQVRF